MKIYISDNSINLIESDIKWYLFDEQIWITKYDDYNQIEKAIKESVGSFNWLYDINDTLLFDKNDGCFTNGIIKLSDTIKISNFMKDGLLSKHKVINGNIMLRERDNFNYTFSDNVVYSVNNNCLFSYDYEERFINAYIVHLTKDFSFVIDDNRLKGWILMNPLNHIFVCDSLVSIDSGMLIQYLEANKLMYDNDYSGVKKLYDRIKNDRNVNELFKNKLYNLIEA